MQQVKITELRADLPDFLKKVINGKELQITYHGKPIARIIPEIDETKKAQQRLDALRGTVITGDIISPIEGKWGTDANNL